MVTITVSSNCFGNNKQYIAHITGRAEKYTFAREFVGRKIGKRFDTTEYSTDEIGLYEDCDIDKKGSKDPGYLIVATLPTGEIGKLRSNLEDAMKIANRLDGGEQIMDMIEVKRKPDDSGWTYELRSKAEAAAAVSGATIESATEACWQIMQALPEREAKKVLAALKLRVSPKTEPMTDAAVSPSVTA